MSTPLLIHASMFSFSLLTVHPPVSHTHTHIHGTQTSCLSHLENSSSVTIQVTRMVLANQVGAIYYQKWFSSLFTQDVSDDSPQLVVSTSPSMLRMPRAPSSARVYSVWQKNLRRSGTRFDKADRQMWKVGGLPQW